MRVLIRNIQFPSSISEKLAFQASLAATEKIGAMIEAGFLWAFSVYFFLIKPQNTLIKIKDLYDYEKRY